MLAKKMSIGLTMVCAVLLGFCSSAQAVDRGHFTLEPGQQTYLNVDFVHVRARVFVFNAGNPPIGLEVTVFDSTGFEVASGVVTTGPGIVLTWTPATPGEHQIVIRNNTEKRLDCDVRTNQ